MEKSIGTENFILQGIYVDLFQLIQDQKKLLSTKTTKNFDLEDSQTLQDDIPPSKNF